MPDYAATPAQRATPMKSCTGWIRRSMRCRSTASRGWQSRS